MENYQNTKERRDQEVERCSTLVTKVLNTLRLDSKDGVFYKESLKQLLGEISGTKRAIIIQRLIGRKIISKIGKDNIGSLYVINNFSKPVYIGECERGCKSSL